MTSYIEQLTTIKTKYHQWGPFLLRVVIGYGAMVHGWAKLSRGPAGFEKLLVQIGIPFPHLNSWLVPITEVGCGLAVMLGVFVSFASIPLIITMIVAMIFVQMGNGFSSVNTIGLSGSGPIFGPPGYEINLLYIAGLLSLILSGAGIFSLESVFKNFNKRSIQRTQAK
ncbi:MAG TPA: DoxX family protein [Candidatus Kapabacteria bacterium]|nr:DoxX family protein [Candidatus Kapabacteria bacterium]